MAFKWSTVEEIYRKTPHPKEVKQVEAQFPGALGIWCQFFGWGTFVNMIDGAIIIVHGPAGCSTAVRSMLDQHFQEHFGLPFMNMVNSPITRDTVILGGEEDLEKTILEVDRDYKPKLILIANSCATDIIMDDGAAVIRRLQPKVKAKLAFHPVAGYRSCWVDYREIFMKPFVHLMDPPEKIQKGTVNLMGNYKETWAGVGHKQKFAQIPYPSDVDELTRMVEGIGLKVHGVLFGGGDYDALRKLPEAEANAIVCSSWGYPLSWEMEKMFGTPWMKHHRPLGFEASKKWIDEIATFMKVQKQADEFVNREWQETKELYAKTKEACKGKVALLEFMRNGLIAIERGFAQTRWAVEMGMEPVIFNFHPLTMPAEYYTTDYFIDEGLGNVKMLDHNYPWAEPVNVDDIMKDLGLSDDEVVYFPLDIFRYCRSGRCDVNTIARYDGEQPFRRVKAASRGDGFTGARMMMRDIMEGLQGAKRKVKPTLMGRMFGKPLDFE